MTVSVFQGSPVLKRLEEVQVAGPRTPGLVPRELGSLGWAGQDTFQVVDDTLLDCGEHGGRVWLLSRPRGMDMRGSTSEIWGVVLVGPLHPYPEFSLV